MCQRSPVALQTSTAIASSSSTPDPVSSVPVEADLTTASTSATEDTAAHLALQSDIDTLLAELLSVDNARPAWQACILDLQDISMQLATEHLTGTGDMMQSIEGMQGYVAGLTADFAEYMRQQEAPQQAHQLRQDVEQHLQLQHQNQEQHQHEEQQRHQLQHDIDDLTGRLNVLTGRLQHRHRAQQEQPDMLAGGLSALMGGLQHRHQQHQDPADLLANTLSAIVGGGHHQGQERHHLAADTDLAPLVGLMQLFGQVVRHL